MNLIDNSPYLSDTNKLYFHQFARKLRLQGRKERTVYSHVQKSHMFFQSFTGDFKEVSKDDLEDYYLQIKDVKAVSSVWGEMLSLKLFLKNLLGEETANNLFSDIRPKRPGGRDRAEEVLVWDDVKKLLDHEKSLRDRAIIMFLWDTGVRVGELTSMTIQDVRFEQSYAIAHVSGKTGERLIPFTLSIPAMQAWINVHSFSDDPEAPLFNSTRVCGVDTVKCKARRQVKSPLHQHRVQTKLKTLGEIAGLQKPVNPHAFRRAAATRLRQIMTPEELEEIMGWVQGSTVASKYYAKINAQTIINKRMSEAGIKITEDEAPTGQPRICPRCQTLNANDAIYCMNCSLILDPATAKRIQEIQRQAENDFAQMKMQLRELEISMHQNQQNINTPKE